MSRKHLDGRSDLGRRRIAICLTVTLVFVTEITAMKEVIIISIIDLVVIKEFIQISMIAGIDVLIMAASTRARGSSWSAASSFIFCTRSLEELLPCIFTSCLQDKECWLNRKSDRLRLVDRMN